MLQLVIDRPIFARAATDNIGSILVLQKCGFKIIGKNKDSPMAEVKTRKNTFFAWISIKQMNELTNQTLKRTKSSVSHQSTNEYS